MQTHDLSLLSLPALVDSDHALARWGRYLDADVLVEIGADTWMLHIHQGKILRARQGPFRMPSFTFAIRIDADAFADFLRPEPPPGRNDLMALVRHRLLALEGNLHPFFSHLIWFKLVFAKLREAPAT
jgi:hypothetical protein